MYDEQNIKITIKIWRPTKQETRGNLILEKKGSLPSEFHI